MKTREISLMDGRVMSYGATGSDEFNAGYELRQIQEQEERKHNGWTNYATWRINLELFDSWLFGDVWGYEDQDPKTADAYELGETLKEYATERIEEDCSANSLALSYALAFISEVNWAEIAQHMIDGQIAENAYNERGAVV